MGDSAARDGAHCAACMAAHKRYTAMQFNGTGKNQFNGTEMQFNGTEKNQFNGTEMQFNGTEMQ
jgi:hypothetical protein